MLYDWGTRWRSSYWFVTFVVGLGIATDLLVYSIVIPVLPFHLEHLHYHGVSGLVGWLLFAYSGGLVLATVPTAMLSERYNSRKLPLMVGLVALIGSQIMLMEAPTYWVMSLARVIQGVSSAIVWVVGLALLCDCTPPNILGRQLGIAMSGLSIGVILGPPLGGFLYDRFGFRGPLIFGIAVGFVDLVGRLLIIEPKDLEKLRLKNEPQASTDLQETSTVQPISDSIRFPSNDEDKSNGDTVVEMTPQAASQVPPLTESSATSEGGKEKLISLGQVLIRLAKSPRALCAMLVTLTNGLVFAMIEPSLPFHLQDVWGLNSTRVGVVFIAGLAPSLLSSPLAGYLSDKFGPEWIMTMGMVLSLPWWLLLIIRKELGMFVSFFVFASFTVSAVISPVTAELASVSRHIEGVGFAHVYGAFNIAYGVGSALGPIIGGQIYEHVKNAGWSIICGIIAGILLVCIPLMFGWTGEVPLWRKLKNRLRVGQA